MSRRTTTLALALANAVGFSGTTALPLWLAALPKAGVLSPGLAGALGSGEVLAIALSTMAASAFGARLPVRTLAVCAALAALGGDLLSLIPHPAALVLGRLIAGAGTGALLGVATSFAARREGAQKVLASMQLGLMVFATAFYLIMPRLIGSAGALSIFAGLALAAAAAAGACLAWLPREAAAHAGDAPRAPLRLIPGAAAACLAIALIFVGQSAVWNFVVAIGQQQGLSMQTVGAVMAACAAVNIAGPLAGRLLGERLGLAGPMLVAFSLLALDALLITQVQGLAAFATGTVLLVLLPGFALPYAFAFLARKGDDRYAGAGPAFLMLGSAAGPALGAAILKQGSVPGLGLAAATIVLVASGLLALSAMIGRRSATAQPAAAGGG